MKSMFVVGPLALASCVGLASANILVNGSFEQPVLGASGVQGFLTGQTIGTGWVVQSTTTSATVLSDAYSGGGADWPIGSDGNQYLYVGDSLGTSVVSQDVVLAGGVLHTLTFDFATFRSPGIPGRLTLDVIQGGSSVLVGGPFVLNVPFTGASGVFAPHSLSFTTTVSGTYTVQFASTSGLVANVDNFDLVPAPGAAGLWLLAAGVGARRRRR